MTINLENHLTFGSTFGIRIVDLFFSFLSLYYFFILFFGDESTVMSKALISQVLSAMVPHFLLLVEPCSPLLEVPEYTLTFLLPRQWLAGLAVPTVVAIVAGFRGFR